MKDVPDLPNLDGLAELGARDNVDIRPTLLRVMTDLYIQKDHHSEQEERHFTELALRLIDLVDAETRAVVARKIAAHPAAPLAVRQRLMKSTPAAMVEPKRPAARSASGGEGAASELDTLFFSADAEERRLILTNLSYSPLSPAAAVNPAVAQETIHRLEIAALAHNAEAFVRELERTLAVSREFARSIMDDESGEPIVIAAIALGMTADTLQRILLCLHPAVSRSVRRIHELTILHEDIEPASALRMIAIWRAAHPPERKSQDPPSGQAPQRRRDERRDNPPAPTTRPRIRRDDYAQARKTDNAS